jgi:tRNA(Ile)-lysidine synthase
MNAAIAACPVKSMRTPLEQDVLEAIRRAHTMAPGDRVGVAVSGGADSVALLRLLENLRGELGVTLLVLHFDHALRGAESDADAQFVAELARDAGLEFIGERADVGAEAKRQGWNLEDAARRLRYAFFERVCASGRATLVAVGHTAEDQAETLLAHLIRGTGPTGLGGIYPKVGCVVRPLLETHRRELRAYLRERDQSWREDSSNQDTRRLRARIREELLPVLERDFSPAIVNHLVELSRLAREQEVFWSALVEDSFHAHVRAEGDAFAVSIPHLLSPFSLANARNIQAAKPNASEANPLRTLTERLIRRLYEELRGDRRELAASHVEQVIHLATQSSSGRRLELPGGILVGRNFGELTFSCGTATGTESGRPENRGQSSTYEYVVRLPNLGAATVSIPELGSRFRLKVIDWTLTESDTKRDGEALDADLLRAPLILRNWRPGDAYRPSGSRQTRKLKRMFLAGRVPSGKRAGWPVLESGGRVIWARGMPPAGDFCAREKTRVGLLIEEDRLWGESEGRL